MKLAILSLVALATMLSVPGPKTKDINIERCLEFLPIKRLQGIYVVGYEESVFLIDQRTVPTAIDMEKRGIWADYYGDDLPGAKKARDGAGRRFYAVEIVARYAPVKGAFGPRGASDTGMLITRFVKYRLLKS
jgi:hypothetical protein